MYLLLRRNLFNTVCWLHTKHSNIWLFKYTFILLVTIFVSHHHNKLSFRYNVGRLIEGIEITRSTTRHRCSHYILWLFWFTYFFFRTFVLFDIAKSFNNIFFAYFFAHTNLIHILFREGRVVVT